MTELLPCPLCSAQPVRNGRGRVGGVVCRGSKNNPHLVQSYGATQEEADQNWNIRPEPPLHGYAEGIEAAAKLAEERATACRTAGVLEEIDPIEAQILDEHLSECAAAIRALTPKEPQP